VAYAAAEASAMSGDREHARQLAETSATWHARNGNPVAEAESWQLAGQFSDSVDKARHLARAVELAEQVGDWRQAATCRRWRLPAVQEADGIATALVALGEALAALDSVRASTEAEQSDDADADGSPSVLDEIRWQRLTTIEQGARVRATAGQFEEALADLDGLDDAYREVGDARSVRDVLGLRGQILLERDDVEAAMTQFRSAAEDALAQGDDEHSRMFGGRLASLLDDHGRPDEAAEVWDRFGD
jgi:tetratricopeptide (TPR) repeat protein